MSSNRPGTHRPGQTDGASEERSMFSEPVYNEAGEQVIDFDRATDITANIRNPIDIIQTMAEAPVGQVSTSIDNIYNPEDPDGTVGRILANFTASVGNISLQNPEDSYMNNFIVNLHNYNIPVPLPLQYFITSFEISSSQTAPYQSCSFTLKMPASLAMDLFQGPNAHPEPGQWICVRHLPNDNDDDVFNIDMNREWAQGLSDQAGEGMTDLQFLGTVTSLDWDIITEQGTGNIVTRIKVQANSFIHNLMFAEYAVKNASMSDQTFTEILEGVVRYDDFGNAVDAEGDVIVPAILNERDANSPLSDNYYIKWPYWRRLLAELASGAVGRTNLKVSLQRLVKGLGYPMLPASIQNEPTDFVHFIFDFIEDLKRPTDLVTRLKMFYTTFGPQIGTLMINGAISVMEMLQIESPIVNSTSIESTAARLYGQFVDDMGNDLFEARDPEVGDTITEVEELRNFLGDPQLNAAEPITIGRLIHVATTRDDIPPSHPLWGTMPHKDEPFIDMNRIKNYGMKTTTVWDLITGTFQPDSQIIELYPTILNASNRDVVDFYKAKGISINPIYQKLGGIPTVILRMKPTHPMIGRRGITRNTLDKEKKFNRERGAAHYSYRNNMEYIPASETVKDPVTGRVMADFKDNSYGQSLPYERNEIIPSSHPDYLKARSFPVWIYPHEIKSMKFSQTDRARVNSVKVSSPEVANMSSRLRYASEGNMVHNTEMALRHGWRTYNPTWPYAEYRGSPSTRPSAQTIINAGEIYSALSERMYIIYGDDQMYFKGTLVCSSQLSKSITPGCWIEIPMNESYYMLNNYLKDAKYKRQNNILAYVKAVTHAYTISQSDGTLSLETIIAFERGSYGGIVANIPAYRGPSINTAEYLRELGLPDTDDAITAAQSARATRTEVPSYLNIITQDAPTDLALRAYVTLRISKGDMTPEEGQAIIASGEIPSDDYSLYQTLVTRFGGNDSHDTDGVDD